MTLQAVKVLIESFSSWKYWKEYFIYKISKNSMKYTKRERFIQMKYKTKLWMSRWQLRLSCDKKKEELKKGKNFRWTWSIVARYDQNMIYVIFQHTKPMNMICSSWFYIKPKF